MQHSLRRLAGAVTLVCALGGVVTAAALADNYVALGDSLLVGHRHARLLAELGLPARRLRLPGADQGRPAQHEPDVRGLLAAPRRPTCSNNQVQSLSTSTNIVTITIGGNDAGFSSVITQCALPAGRGLQQQHHERRRTTSATRCRAQLNSVYSQIRDAGAQRDASSCSATRACSWAWTATPARSSAPTR